LKILKKISTRIQDARTVYDITVDYCNYGGIIPDVDDLVKIRADIVSGDLSTLNVIQTERFQYYLDQKDAVVFLSHTLQ